VKTVPLHGAKAAGRVALVDDEDYELVMQYRWFVLEAVRASGTRTGPYAQARPYDPATRKQSGVYMHKLITGWSQTDHINRNGLDNRRRNLRPATTSQNGANRGNIGGVSPYKGVAWGPRQRKWRASITVAGVRHWLGYFADEVGAARAFDATARKLCGEFAYLNFPDDDAA
jgi:hypothetical protein